MNLLSTMLLGFALACASIAADAQVYESRDAQGNPVFSDTPSPGAEVVELPESNLADPVDVPAAAGQEADHAAEEPSAPISTAPGTASRSGDKVIVIGDQGADYSPAADRKIGHAEPREQVRDAQRREEVLSAQPREQVLDAEPRQGVLDAEPRRQVD